MSALAKSENVKQPKASKPITCSCLCHSYAWVYHSKECNPEVTDGEKCCAKARTKRTDMVAPDSEAITTAVKSAPKNQPNRSKPE